MVAYQLLFGALGLLCGIGVAAGVFALVASLGMVPRMAGKTSVAAYVPALENGLIALIGIPNIRTHAKYTKINAAPP